MVFVLPRELNEKAALSQVLRADKVRAGIAQIRKTVSANRSMLTTNLVICNQEAGCKRRILIFHETALERFMAILLATAWFTAILEMRTRKIRENGFPIARR